MDKRMSRKAFFAHIGVGILTLVGITGLVKGLQDYTDKSIRKASTNAGTIGSNNSQSNSATTTQAKTTSVVTKTDNYTIATTDDIILADTTGGNLVMTLPSAVNSTKTYTIKRIGSSNNSVTVNPAPLQTVDDNPTFAIKERNFSLTVVSDGKNWKIV